MKTTGAIVSTSQEEPAFISSEDEELFGIFTDPVDRPRGTTVILLPGGGYLASINRNRFSVRLARDLASVGFHAIRFDYHGVGESTGIVERFRLDRPFVSDVRSVVEYAHARVDTRTVLVGVCFGARTALACVPSLEHLSGLVLVSPPIRDFQMGELTATRLAHENSTLGMLALAANPRTIGRLLDAGRRQQYLRIARTALKARWQHRRSKNGPTSALVSRNFLDPLRAAVDRRIPILLVFGTEDDLWHEFERARSSPMGAILRDGRATIEIKLIEGHVHGLSRLSIQDAVGALVREWLTRTDLSEGSG